MTKQYIWALAIVGAFVAGTVLASTLYDNTAFAIHQPNHNPPSDDDDMGWKEAVSDLQMQIDNIDTQDDLLGFYRIQHNVSFSGATTITSVTTECDSGDVAVSGGYAHGLHPDLVVTFSGVSGLDPDTVGVSVDTPPDGSSISLHGICADFDPVHVP